MSTPIPSVANDGALRWTAQTVSMSKEVLDVMDQAVTKVRERLLRATEALNRIGIPYAVVGGNAVASWVATVDEGAVRNTRDVDLLVRRDNLIAVQNGLEQAGFLQDRTSDGDIFRDRLDTASSAVVRILFSGEKVRPVHSQPAPAIETIDDPAGFRVIVLDSLVEMKLVPYRTIDKVHLRDLIDVGLLNRTWLSKFPPELAERLQHILDTPDG